MNVIFIFFNTGGYNFYIYSGLFVYVSNTTNIFDGTLCYKNNTFAIYTRPVDISIPCRMNGQFIILKSVKRQCAKDSCWLSGCEVSVYGNML